MGAAAEEVVDRTVGWGTDVLSIGGGVEEVLALGATEAAVIEAIIAVIEVLAAALFAAKAATAGGGGRGDLFLPHQQRHFTQSFALLF